MNHPKQLAALAVYGFLVIATILLGISFGISNGMTKRFCLAHGWPDAAVTWQFERYCIKRIDQTDVVVPVDALEAP